MSGEDWADYENDLIVADYFAMLTAELLGVAFNKSEHRRNLMPLLADRPKGAIEFKHQNISAVLVGMGQQRINGYPPLARFQNSLADAVLRWLDANPAWMARDFHSRAPAADNRVREVPTLWIGPPPTFANEPPPIDPKFMAAIARKYDVAERDARNRGHL